MAKGKSKGNGQKKSTAMDVDGAAEEKKKGDTEDVVMNGHGVSNGADIKLTPIQIQVIRKAIASAKTNEECDKLAKILESGRIPEGDWNKLTEQQ